MTARRILFATPELAPLNKLGGLGDAGRGLVNALQRDGCDVRILIPGYPQVKRHCHASRPLLNLLDPDGRPGCLLEARAAGLDAPLYVVDFPHHFDLGDSPYGDDSLDTARAFAAFARGGARIAGGALDEWRPDVVHCNDWPAGLVPTLLASDPARPATVFTIHNLAHHGLFPPEALDDLQLPAALWSMHALEFHGRLSFIKGGLVFADRVNTVSPTYAREILTPAFGCGLDGLLGARRTRLSGILNGVDYQHWNPAADPFLTSTYDAANLRGKAQCKAHLARRLGLDCPPGSPLVAMVTRLTPQKGIDLVIDAWAEILDRGAQLIVLGTGEDTLERSLARLAAAHPGRSAVRLAYDEELAHQIIAGADMFLMPSRFEPCGLTQLYSLRYGTVPVAARTGGLNDTVVDATPARRTADRATGFLFAPGSREALLDALDAAIECFGSEDWRQIQRTGMQTDFSWDRSARQYRALYERALADRVVEAQE